MQSETADFSSCRHLANWMKHTRRLHCQRGRKPPKFSPSPWDFVTWPVENRATAIGNMHKNFGKDRACGSGDILEDRQTHRHKHPDVLIAQYFAKYNMYEYIQLINCNNFTHVEQL